MKTNLTLANLPTTNDLATWNTQLQQLLTAIMPHRFTLSMEDRQGKRKMGSRRLAYGQSANRLGVQHENVMPRQFDPNDFSKLMNYHSELNTFLSRLVQLQEICDDTLMAAGIDAMTYTKVVHDSLRTANNLDPMYDEALRELDEFNARAQAEDTETTV